MPSTKELDNSACSSPHVFRHFLSGAIGGVCKIFVGQPFDTIKVRLQTSQYTGLLDCVQKTVVREGVKGFYSGMAAPLVGASPLFALFFASASVGRSIQQTTPDQELSFVQNANSGALAGLSTSIVMTPSERIKCLLQVQQQSGEAVKYGGPMDVIRRLYRTGGIRSIYRGWGATILRDVPASAAYISVYEYLKDVFARDRLKTELSPLTVLFAGGIAGVAHWSVCIPTDMMKSKLQTAPDGQYPNGIRDVFREVIRVEGPAGFFRGFTVVMLRAFPSNAACFLGVELTLSFFDWWDRN